MNTISSTARRNAFYLRILWGIYIFALLLIVLIFILISERKLGFLPAFEELENPKNNLASELFSDRNELIAKFFIENRTFADYKELSPYVVDALIATEDIRFNKHSGVDARGLGRVLFRTILARQKAGGGSTITQQLAKNLFSREKKGNNFITRTINLIIVKFKEWHTAVRLERFYTKNEILTMYLNTVTFGHETFGIKSASRIFFDTTPDSLKLEQAAVLVGLLKAQTYYSPVLNPENSLKRRNVVLSQMKKYGFITPELYDSVKNIPIELNYGVESHDVGLATHFRQFLARTMTRNQPIKSNYYSYDSFVEDSVRWEKDPLFGWCNKNFKPDGSTYDIYRDGLKIYTTLNYNMQRYAEEAVNEHLGKTLQKEFFAEKKGRKTAPFSEDLTTKEINNIMMQSIRRTERYIRMRSDSIDQDSIMRVFKKPRMMKVFTWNGEKDTLLSPMDSVRYYKYFLRAGFMAMDPFNGYVKAYVGGHNHKYFKYDQVTQGKRQVGSTVKPFLYTLAMQEGDRPCDMVPNVEITFPVKDDRGRDTTWTPKNSGNFEMEGKWVTLKWGLAHSVNYISAYLVKKYNPQSVIDIMKKMGITSKVDAVPSVIYGTSDISLKEMVAAFNTFTNKGVYIEPLYVTRIEDKNGTELAKFQSQQVEAISENTAFLMVKLLQGVVNRGTGHRLRWYFNFTGEMGGKTGTTQNQSDGWYLGITPKLTAGAWVGAEDRSVHFDRLSQGAGGYTALPIWGLFFQKVYADTSLHITQEDVFPPPLNFNVKLNCPDYIGDTSDPDAVLPKSEDYIEF